MTSSSPGPDSRPVVLLVVHDPQRNPLKDADLKSPKVSLVDLNRRRRDLDLC